MTNAPLRILLIDDSLDDQTLVVEMLGGGDREFQIKTACDSEESLSLIERWNPDCILLDYWLGNETGMNLLSRIHEIVPHCPVIVLTGNGSEKVAAASIKCGALEYFRKSDLNISDIRKSIRNAIEVANEQREVARRADDLQRLGRLDALGDLAGGLAHDFNNLMTITQYAVTMGLKETKSGVVRSHLNSALDSLQRGAELTERLRAFAAHQPATVSARRIGDVIATFVTLVSSAIDDHIRMETIADNPDITVECDQSQLDHALVNLALNARDAIRQSGKGGLIELRIAAAQSLIDGVLHPFVEFTLRDDGPGMTRQVHERATDPYFTTKTRGSGTGLGLAMVYGFVQQSHGEFAIDTEVGAGTAVRFRLRQGKPMRAAKLASAPDRPCSASIEPPSDRPPRILLVDDELLLLLEAALIIRDFGFEVLEASSGAEALTMIDPKKPVDLLLTDVQMPGMDGFALAKAARAKQPDIKVIYFSGYTGFSDGDMGPIRAPLITKPCSPNELERRLRDALSPAQESEIHPPSLPADPSPHSSSPLA